VVTASDADRAKAAELACCPDCWQTPLTQVDAIAAALAEARATERAAADQLRADVEKLAEELLRLARATEGSVLNDEPSQYKADQLGLAIGYRRSATRLRAILDAR
jgi:hypothetical protein